jgi:hypothetical protein
MDLHNNEEGTDELQAEATLSVEEKDVLKKADKAEKAESECIAGKAVIESEVKLAGKVCDNTAVEEKEITEKVVPNKTVAKEDTVIDEFCSNASFDEGKSAPTPSPPPPPPSRPLTGLGSVDYFAMRFEDFCELVVFNRINKIILYRISILG